MSIRLRWIGFLSGVYSHLVPSAPGIGSGLTQTLIKMKCLMEEKLCTVIILH